MSDKTGTDVEPKTASNVMVNVTINIDKDMLSEVMVEVLRDATIMKNLGQEGFEALAKFIKK
mgnify:CR=1 FL=1